MVIHEINQQLSKQFGYCVVQLPEPIIGIVKFTDYVDDIQGSSNLNIIRRELSYSQDSINWSEYEIITRNSLNGDKLLSNNPLYLKFKFTKLDDTPNSIIIRNVKLEFEYTGEEDDCEPKLVNEYMGLEFCVDPEFDPHVIGERAAELETALNGHISKAYGMKVRYFATEPDADTTDGVLNEYSLWQESSKGGCEFKIQVPENSLPDPDLLHTEWGLELERFEVHIAPQLFEVTFGKSREPRQEDFLHIYKFNALYFIGSVKPFRGTDGILQYWVANLKKYDNNSAVEKSQETQDYLDTIINSHENNFQEEIEKEAIDITNPQQYSTKNIENDNVREFIAGGVIIEEEIISNNGTPVTSNVYDMSVMSMNELAVVYKPKVNITDNQSITYWINSLESSEAFAKFGTTSVMRLDRYTVKMTIDKPIVQTGIVEGGFISRNNYHFLVQEIINDNTIILFTKNKVIDGEYENVKSIKLPSTAVDDKGYTIYLIRDTDLYVYLGRELYILNSSVKPEGWYANIINISLEFCNIYWYVYEIEDRSTYPDRRSTALKLLSKSSQELPELPELKVDGLDAYLTSGSYRIANIRFWNKTIEQEYHNLVLNQIHTENASLAYIIDNPDTLYLFDKMGKGRINFADDEPEYK